MKVTHAMTTHSNDERNETVRREGEREYDLQEAARLLNKTESALRMQIRRNSIRAIKRPLDDGSGRYKYFIPESEIEKERRRLEEATLRSEMRRHSSTATTQQETPRPPFGSLPATDANATPLALLTQRVEHLERELQQEREDVRVLIRSLEKQVEMLQMMLRTLLDRD